MNSHLFTASQRCVRLLCDNGMKISFAESCTGGLLAKAVTEHSGASSVFECGVVSYCGRIKHKLLNVSTDTLATFGEVSAEVAIEMAQGVRVLSDADIGVGITGIAGPTGATLNKKVGLIYVAISTVDRTQVHKLEYYAESLTRLQRREMAACFAFEQVISLFQ